MNVTGEGIRVKAMIIAGILIMVFGAIVLFRGISYPSERSFVKVGGFEASVQEHRVIPAWVGGVAIVGGLALIIAGKRHGH
jgi:uncharacterized membrane protein